MINRIYNAEKTYHVLGQCCVQAGKVVEEETGDTYTETVASAIATFRALKGRVRNSNELYMWQTAHNVLSAAKYDF